MSYPSQQRRRFQKKNARATNASWRVKPPTEGQTVVLRRIERETGQQFPPSITRGEASDVIGRRFADDPEARRAHRRATRARRRSRRRSRPGTKRHGAATASNPYGWLFGVGQSFEQEKAEIRRAMESGLTEQYMAMQAQARQLDRTSATATDDAGEGMRPRTET